MPPRHLKPTLFVKATKQVMNLLPDRLGFPILQRVSAQIDRSPLTEAQSEALVTAERLTLAGRPLYRWGQGPTVLLVHGWAGRAGQMAPLAATLAAHGFQAIAFDVRGHGEAPGRTTSWRTFQRDIMRVTQALERPLFACVGHSAGALSLMASRQQNGLAAEKFVGICSPSHPFPAIDFIRRILAPSDGVMEAYRKDVASQFGCTWAELEAAHPYYGAGPETLLVYDTGDKIVPLEEGIKIQGYSSGINLSTLGPCGHTKILSDPTLGATVLDFLLEKTSSKSK